MKKFNINYDIFVQKFCIGFSQLSLKISSGMSQVSYQVCKVNFMKILLIFKILTRNVLEKRLKISSNLAEAFRVPAL